MHPRQYHTVAEEVHSFLGDWRINWLPRLRLASAWRRRWINGARRFVGCATSLRAIPPQSDSVDTPKCWTALPARHWTIAGPSPERPLRSAVFHVEPYEGTSRGTDSAELSSFRMSMQWYYLAISTKTHVDPILALPPYITPSKRHS
ncbi:hypothetical protein AOQ84DRAFT_227801 [Glonium stellatum]|uniref:Uncharacterized protein n=1 Tax=Glonium stellatum TaxID=574774 RepID=A0A8E2F8G3_9PEZI|nr:hypothetical protein AOQ84DRAFT_227801 [Glonium stellatum]